MRSITYTNPIGGSITFYQTPYLITSLDGIDLPKINIYEQKSPYQDGSTSIDQLWQPREIVLTGAINAPNNIASINTHKRTIISALNPKAGAGTLTYTNDNATYKINNVLPQGPLFKNKELTNPFQEFQITFYCFDPYLYDNTVTSTGLTSSQTIVNSGDVITPILVSITGACTNPVIGNTTSGYSITYNGSFTGTLTINTAFGNKYAKLGTSNVIANITSASTFWGLLLGNNTVTFSCSSGTPNVILSYYNRYNGA